MTKSFFNENWQELESQTDSEVTSYVWGLRYIDDLVLREKGEEQLYSLADPNWNVVTVCDVSGDIQERYTYDAFGKRNVFDANFTAKTTSDFNWNRAFTGQVLDAETGLMLYRNRFYSAIFGRWGSRDVIECQGEDINLYRYIGNKVQSYIDSNGLQIVPLNPIYDISDIIGQLPLNYPGFYVASPTPEPDCPAGWKIEQASPPVANGCGAAGAWISPMLASIGQYVISSGIFTPSCNNHDLCWGNCSSDRKTCDNNFLKDMTEACSKKFPGKKFYTERQWCFKMANIFYNAVASSTGNSGFAAARKNNCKCVPDCKK